jgi:sporulation protein YlmC with PRC-barrel domain
MLKRTLVACFLATTALAAPALAQSTNFITEQTATQWRASKFVGVDIYGTDNAKIGDVNEVLLDASGNAQAVVIGVGGFLGIGEKNVAVPFTSVQWKSEPVQATTASTAPRSDVSSTGTTAANPPTAAPTAAPAAPVDTAAQGYPDHGMLAMTKADLQNAPDFKYYGAKTASTSTTTAPATPSATAPAGGMSSPMGGAPATAPKP